MFRRLGQAKTVGARALVFDVESRVLLVRHTYRPGWHTPGGGVNEGESPLDAVKREVFEETGLVLATEPTLFGVYINRWQGLSDYPILYVVRNQHGEPRVNDRSEIAAVGWFGLDELPPGTTPKTRRRIEEVMGMKDISREW
jgi:ADP-ribose pyrophosphatase YjhB (NUDIX family)